jgi:hypothetical protein
MYLQNYALVDQARRQAGEQFHRLQGQAVLGKLWGTITRQPQALLNLDEVQKTVKVQSRRHGGLKLVPIAQIRGSEGRCDDFDAKFRPLQRHTKDRWIGVAVAYTYDVALPPVELVQIGDVYFVRDGHHRLSVANLYGQQEIEAEVTVFYGTAEQVTVKDI